ncbi:hypothetical protein COCSUDRAFT_54847 [Coccomyxa subellipsoidea C-169]|uniref:Cupin type-2 domain-containing protein n=1 Tax=Coccomyxa subellipsoidea (strain C-169) TaxID=574566 RepID=I0YJQ9_COCSC|nr:hypothetical protein COCSUDRAFT_54847 [Coccomyxa subellipsoidea C-169]EIE18628.1 hypothetical protein COCSUDRAFT_54847 [Coccomyxa subellipsoidea C-169]|eukprot:XP_005643172.1 hypothetical protein COCSUDRAFT_54847 [Coccomyxa subellipsoidea C-169]
MHAARFSGQPCLNSGALKSRRRTTFPVEFKVSMNLKIEKWDSRTLGELSRRAMLDKLQREGYNTTVYTFGPGTSFGDHSHPVDKKDAILGGRFLFRMGGEEVILEPGDQLEVPKGKTHYAECVGSEPVTFVDASKQSIL